MGVAQSTPLNVEPPTILGLRYKSTDTKVNSLLSSTQQLIEMYTPIICMSVAPMLLDIINDPSFLDESSEGMEPSLFKTALSDMVISVLNNPTEETTNPINSFINVLVDVSTVDGKTSNEELRKNLINVVKAVCPGDYESRNTQYNDNKMSDITQYPEIQYEEDKMGDITQYPEIQYDDNKMGEESMFANISRFGAGGDMIIPLLLIILLAVIIYYFYTKGKFKGLSFQQRTAQFGRTIKSLRRTR